MIPSRISALPLLRFMLAAVCLAVSLGAPRTEAFDEFPYDLRLAQALADAGMTDYAQLQIARLLKQYPDRQDQIYLAKARIHYQLNQRSQGNTALDQIKPSSPVYIESRLLIANQAMQTGDIETAKQAYRDFFAQNQKPTSDDPGSVKLFTESVQMYAHLYVQEGDAKGATEVLNLLKNLEGKQELTDAQITFLRGQFAFAAIENAVAKGEEIDEEYVKDMIKGLVDVQWSSGMNYAILVGALIEAAHGQILLHDYKAAIKTLMSIQEQLQILDNSMPPKDSPAAGALFYFGRALKGLGFTAFQANDQEKAAKYLEAAAERFRSVTDKYQASSYGTRALVEFGKCRELLATQFDPPIRIEGPAQDVNIGSLLVKKEQADEYFAARDYGQAAPLFLECARLGRQSGQFPAIGNRLAYAYGQNGEFLKAQAISSYLAEVFPTADETAATLLQIGALFYARADQVQDADERDQWIDRAMSMWDRLAEVAPEHPNAADVAFAVAENGYRKASTLADATSAEDDREKKEALKEEARESFRQAVPKYERIIDVFGATPKGVRAHYKLGWIYYSLERPKLAAENFVRYSVLEKDPKNQGDRLQAKFRAAEQLMFSDTPAAAIPHFKELLEWLKPGNPYNFDVKTAAAETLREEGSSYLAWSYDLAAEVYRPELRRIDEAVDALEAAVEEYEATADLAAGRATAAVAMVEAAAAALAETVEPVKAGIPDPEAAALKEKMPSAEDLAKMSEAAKKMMLPKAREEAIPLAVQFRKQSLQQYDGERQQLTDRQKEVFEDRQEQAGTLERQTQRLENDAEAIAGAEDDLAAITAEHAELEQKLVGVRETLAKVEAEIADWRQEIVSARELFEMGDAQDKQDAKVMRDEARNNLARLSDDLGKARAERDRVDTEERRGQLAALARQVSGLTTRLEVLKQRVAQGSREKALNEVQLTSTEQELRALGKRMQWNELLTALMKLEADARQAKAADEKWETVRDATLAALEALRDAKTAEATLLQKVAKEDAASALTLVAQAQEQIQALKTEREPVAQKFKGDKEQALAHFEAFFKAYPGSRQVADNMARIGTVYIEFENYERASHYLNRLTTEFPGSDAVEQALFNLGKAQFETGKTEAAVATFDKVLDKIDKQSAGNLNYIARRMTEAGQRKVALRIVKELIRRSEDPNSKDYELLAGRTRENLLHRAATAAFEGEDYKQAIALASQLLAENPRTAHFFSAKMILATSKRLMTPPDLSSGRRDLLEVRRFATDDVVTNQALVELARNFLSQDDEAGTRKALAQLGQMVAVTEGRVLVLADRSKAINEPIVQEAFYLAARCYALMGNQERRDLLVETYRREFPEGERAADIDNLPAAKYQALRPATAETDTGA